MHHDVLTSPDAEPTTPRRSRGLTVPSAFTILFLLTVLAVGATWFVPAGSYAKLAYSPDSHSLTVTTPQGAESTIPATQAELDKRQVRIGIEKFTSGAITKPISIPDTYERLPQHRAGPGDITKSMVEGTVEAVDIIVFILVLGGLIGVVKKTGAFETGLFALTKRTKGHEFLLVLAVALLMVLGGTSCGLEEEAVAFYPILVPVFLAMGYDALVSIGAIFLAGSMGTTFSTINPFSSVIASNAAGTSFTDGLGWRIAGCAVGAVAVCTYLWWYARRVQGHPERSYAAADHERFAATWRVGDGSDPGTFTARHKIVLILFVAAFPIMVWGVMSRGWWFPDMASSFLTIAVVIMLLSLTGRDRLGEQELTEAFTAGASSLVGVSLIIGLARGINIVMTEGRITDTILAAATQLVQGMPAPVFVVVMMLVFFVLGFLVPSSSGLAVLAMPIMAPLGDTVGVERSVIVCAYQWGQYAMLYLAPTGLVMATLQMLDVRYSHWVRFVWPMVVFVLVFGGALLVLQVALA